MQKTSYTVGVVAGVVHKDSRIDAVHLAIIIVGTSGSIILLNPSLLERVNAVEFKGVKIELMSNPGI